MPRRDPATARTAPPPSRAAVDACADCLRRTDLIAGLAGRMEVEWRARRDLPRLLALPDEELLEWAGDAAARRRHARFSAAEAVRRANASGLGAVCRCRPGYPGSLRELPDPPAVLHRVGRPPDAEPAVAVVGARRASGYGLEVGWGLSRDLAAAGVPVVSGMALGIDSAAHAGALASGGATVAVLAGGADVPYPAAKRALHRRIASEGCVVSELPPGFRAFRWCFPARNRIIAALSAGTVVVEAAERSGSLLTADFAAELGRFVAAVPGPVTSAGSAGANALLKSGAELVRSAQDVLDLAFGVGVRAVPVARGPGGGAESLPADLRSVLRAVEGGRDTLAQVGAVAGGVTAAAARLGELERRGLLRRTRGGRYQRAV